MKTLVAAALALSIFSAWAGAPTTVSDIPLADCNIKTVANVVSFHDMQRQSELGTESLKQIDLLQKATARAKKPGISVGKQMSPAELEQFARAREHNMSINAVQLIESNYARDIRAVLSMVQVADANLRWDTEPKPASPEFLYYAMIELMRIGLPEQDTTHPAPSHVCTVEVALHSAEDESLRRFDALPVGQANKVIAGLTQKYGLAKFDRTKATEEDIAIYDDHMKNTIRPALKEAHYFLSIEYIKLIAQADELEYVSSLKDMTDSGGNIKSVGSTLKKLSKDKKVSKGLALAFGMREKIEEKVPSEMQKQLSRNAEIIAKAIKDYPVSD